MENKRPTANTSVGGAGGPLGIGGLLPNIDRRRQSVSSLYKRSANSLLGQLKEEHKREEKVGVVPKDLNFGLIKDLIDLNEDDIEMAGAGRGGKKEK